MDELVLAMGRIRTASQPRYCQAAMYDAPATNFTYAQRSLCNKCHAKD